MAYLPQVRSPQTSKLSTGICLAANGKLTSHFAGYSALMDFVLALLPWKIVWNLQMKKKEKFGVATAMSLGVVYVPF